MLDETLMADQVKQDMQTLVQQNMSVDDNGNEVLTKDGAENIAANSLATFWSSVCSYISQNSMVTASWIATNPTSGAPDPVVTTTGKVSAVEGSGLQQAPLKPCEDATSALAQLAIQLNTLMLSWSISWDDVTLLVSPVTIINPGIVLIPVGEGGDGIEDLCGKILDSVKNIGNYVPTFSGTHGPFTGAGTLISIS